MRGAALRIGELVRHAHADGWAVCLIPTPPAAEWLDTRALAELTGHPVRWRHRRPEEPRLPPTDAVAVAPATFNTINKCAVGINDNPALGVVNEAIGLGLPVVVARTSSPPSRRTRPPPEPCGHSPTTGSRSCPRTRSNPPTPQPPSPGIPYWTPYLMERTRPDIRGARRRGPCPATRSVIACIRVATGGDDGCADGV
jgi:hypothetical protein